MAQKHINPELYGVSFSVKQCRKFGIDPKQTLQWLIEHMGFRRFRLMTYWDEVEKTPGTYDFTEIDRQVKQVVAADGVISMCLGVKQPRWPEYHWPDWAWNLPKQERDEKLLEFINAVVNRYKSNNAIVSWHLENEALLTGFGERIEIDRTRLLKEYALVEKLDIHRDVVMSTSAAWGIPVIGPIPDVVGFSYYLIRWNKNKYTTTYHAAWIHRLRALLIRLIWGRKSFIHELQMEPWGPKDIWEMTLEEQDQSMGLKQIEKNFKHGKSTNLYPLDLWGGEWWYARAMNDHDSSIANAVLLGCSD